MEKKKYNHIKVHMCLSMHVLPYLHIMYTALIWIITAVRAYMLTFDYGLNTCRACFRRYVT